MTFYILIFIAQVVGATASGFSTLEECQAERATRIQSQDVLWASECMELPLKKIDHDNTMEK